MKIISKFKDYYDYISNIYGVDPKIILDRRNHKQPIIISNCKVVLFIGNLVIEGIYFKKKFYYGKELLKFEATKSKTGTYQRDTIYFLPSMHYKRDYKKSIVIDLPFEKDHWFYTTPVPRENYHMKTPDSTPVVVAVNTLFYNYPSLKNLNISSILDAFETYNAISTYISNILTIKEKTIPILSDSLKITNKGFDLKKSFRPNIKKK